MVFSSTVFLFLFLPAVLLFYFICPRRLRNGVLLFFSLLFYSWGEPVYVLIMLFSTVFDYVNGLLIERFRQKGRPDGAKWVLVGSVAINLGILAFFKYGNFFIDNLNALTGLGLQPLPVSLPIGISFYTFQTMSYTIDVYRGDSRAQKNIVDFGAFVSMFPQLVAGPIVRYKDIEEQLRSRRESLEGFCYGIRRFVCGLFKKLVFANSLGLLWEQISAAGSAAVAADAAWIGAVAFSLQIYFDFSGYSDMAIGLGRMFGFSFMENFEHPYLSQSVTEFWRRWHISLGTWFREYVYIPLGGSRRGRAITVRNLLIVWGLTGFWHGASWNFLLWGLYFGLLLTMEKLFLLKALKRLPVFLRRFYALFLAVISWVIFAFEDVGEGLSWIGAMFGGGAGIFSADALYYLSGSGLLLLLGALTSQGLPKKLALRWEGAPQSPAGFWSRLALLGLMFLVSLCFLVGSTYNPFLYFRF